MKGSKKPRSKPCPKALTNREVEILKLITMGKSNKEIAEELILSVHTIKSHVCTILHKLSVDDRVQAAVKAVREEMVK